MSSDSLYSSRIYFLSDWVSNHSMRAIVEADCNSHWIYLALACNLDAACRQHVWTMADKR